MRFRIICAILGTAATLLLTTACQPTVVAVSAQGTVTISPLPSVSTTTVSPTETTPLTTIVQQPTTTMPVVTTTTRDMAQPQFPDGSSAGAPSAPVGYQALQAFSAEQMTPSSPTYQVQVRLDAGEWFLSYSYDCLNGNNAYLNANQYAAVNPRVGVFGITVGSTSTLPAYSYQGVGSLEGSGSFTQTYAIVFNGPCGFAAELYFKSGY